GATGFATNNNASLQSLTLNPSTVFGGQTTTGTVALTGAAPAGGSNVAIADNSSVITTPDSAMVPAGATTKSFTVNTSDVAASSVRQVTATLGAVTRTATLTINPSCHPTNLVLNPSTVKGGAASTATVFITQIAPAGGVVLNVTDNSSAINTPETVTVPAGARWTTFTVNTMPVGATFTRTVTVTKVGITRSASLTLTP
ncbi:MAG TPA: hypothetical protein VEX38_05945, partial [Fimbriimonadaceae bacterium]|nr:hypothetical protein [Fimbriimonadaceae bacterium]